MLTKVAKMPLRKFQAWASLSHAAVVRSTLWTLSQTWKGSVILVICSLLQQKTWQKQLCKKEFIWANSPRIQSTIVERTWQQGVQITEHVTSPVMKQRYGHCCSILCCVFGQGPQPGGVPAYLEWLFPHHLIYSKNVSQIYPEVCFCGNSISHQVDNKG